MAGLCAAVSLGACSANENAGSSGTAGATSSTARHASTPSTAPVQKRFELGDVRHVFVIVLENESFEDTFGMPQNDPYLASQLVRSGALLRNFYAIGHASLDNYIAMISGQPPTTDTQGDCHEYVNIEGALGSDGIETGDGCIYPSDVETLANQLTDAHFTWKGYMQDMGNIPSREAAACGHPAIGSPDETEGAVEGDGYATRHDPFVYFHSIIDDAAYCDSHVVALGSPDGSMPASALPGETGLAKDLESVSTTPNFSFITPNLCNDGHDFPCTNQPSEQNFYDDYDTFLETWVPLILRSPAYRQSGMLVVTFDEAESGPAADSSCCGERPGPAAAEPGQSGPGGGIVGAVVLSPFIRPGTVSHVDYNDFSLLATLEGIFGVRSLAEAATVTSTFGNDVFDKP